MGIWMTAKHAAEAVRAEVAAEAARLRAGGIVPKVAALLVEGDPASAYYAETKRKIAAKLGIEFELMTMPREATEEQLVGIVTAWSRDASIHGIMLELPLPGHVSAAAVAAAVDPLKDVDGVTPAAKLAVMTGEPGLYPATPQSCIRLLQAYGYSLEGKHVTLVGRGQTVGMPLFHMLQREQATVTLCHSRTPDLTSHVRRADIVIAAVGRTGLITKDMLHAASVVVDAGINERPDGSIAGDVSADAIETAAAVSPVPGGVGTLTTALLFENAMKAIRLQAQTAKKGAIR
ncbi:bifunctional 5,10-methylenetetrahydrofolate dehydrogenase/5,10-methenyltetrahydrofolate cyclohydrolase [Paenibacillus mesophilus]|uniref:bifunctional 5,10-methylenetetrahydrofolate dehydrogenase/5,10-methenyltetrahydrofolate cyclohydrolase n=1 Tax=Paenibacillus mesophilus TaxID=2582849 RepID=UPI00110E88BC|nr:bifunctional 5,10-methylenetetrahydrofolate dehydrogenase/5,10-methenyltetrahydrofolate cyclohydrolase [Paenibacillus mesophilus]TMV48449.1 bifunctional 5,10-methylenetetrahydrofolate dehydrogenase/5,10-methenyltetrahydrofolate cyclohydrolase [Paenibacillus mesophilus]